MSIGSTYWSARFSRWSAPRPEVAGYSLLMPVPGDLPVFLEMALSVCALQDRAHRIETIVVPDKVTPHVRQVVQRYRPEWDGPLLVAALPLPERVFLPYLRNPFHNYGVQLITGVQAAAGSHVILHDADLFLLRTGLLDERYRRTREEGRWVTGVSPVWDPWYADRGLTIAATWELCATRDWLRSFPPSLHMGHTSELYGEQHTFDITLHAQALSDQRRIAIHPYDDDIVHFNHVIGTYRHFQRAKGTFLDDRFRLLLIRLFVDVFAEVPYGYRLPSLADLRRGLDDRHAEVTYPAPDAELLARYTGFRRNATRMLNGAWIPAAKRGLVEAALDPFDRHYGLK